MGWVVAMVASTLPAVLPATKSLTQFCSLTFCEAGILSLAVVLPSFLSLICEPTILGLAFVTLILICEPIIRRALCLCVAYNCSQAFILLHCIVEPSVSKI